ncbi:phage regulatory CII family protein [Oceanospirillum sediminis]|uniref:Phage regulatory CII family protein n=1 Tax=Oceanospirillum sediminis TaxID=2760088 RepID=A0A839IVU8_9GAMM|nr:phage regulatory CII family protein [Oceanospirillum sediminis]MBB1489078.1 phage regulatory CII family protein [Oceanospirillum sediminis]
MGSRAREHDGGTLSLSQACYHAVYEFEGKAAAVAEAIGINPRTLANKLNANVTTHLLNADEAAAIGQVTRDPRILSALCHEMGATWHWLDEVREAPGDIDVLGHGASVMDAANQSIQELVKALEDGRVDSQEARRIKAAVHDAQRQLRMLNTLAERFMG